MTQQHQTPLSLPPDHLGLYLHVPFCVAKCRYCDFASQPLGGATALVEDYLAALAAEAAWRRREVDRPVSSIFIGGGTPTVLSGAQLRRLWAIADSYPRHPDAEISLEANPGTLTEDVLAALAELPLTRVSLGAQSFHADELAMLGRIHTATQVEEAVAALRAIGIPQINIDLMYALPEQTAARWEASLRRALALRPDHLSMYALTLEEETPLFAQVAAGLFSLPGEEEEEQLAATSAALLEAAGLRLYEVSNAARLGRHSRHNLGYWLGRDYLGLGPSATSALRTVRWRNAGLARYTARWAGGQPALAYVERLSARERLLERVMLGLRLRDGFNLAEAEAAGGGTLAALAPTVLAALTDEGLLAQEGTTLRLTDAGFPLANVVVARLMAASEHSLAA